MADTLTASRDATQRRRLPQPPAWARQVPRVRRVPGARRPAPGAVAVSYALTLLSVIVLSLLLNLALVSQFQHFSAQQDLYDKLRVSLAEGSTPIGQTDVFGKLVTPGTPVALLSIPEIGVHEVVVEGSTSRQTKLGVGHLRYTPLPGQPGVSVLMGRATAYGGVFGSLDKLKAGQTFTVRTGQGLVEYKVIGPRTAHSQLPALTGTNARLTLVTATGAPLLPRKVLYVDAEQVSPVLPQPARVTSVVQSSEQPLKGDPSRLLSTAWLLQLLVIVAAGAVWSWKRWSAPATWIVFTPLLAATGLACADRICDLLPNLM